MAQETTDTCALKLQQTVGFEIRFENGSSFRGIGVIDWGEGSLCGRTSLGPTWTSNMARLAFLLLPLLLSTAGYLGWISLQEILKGVERFTFSYFRAFYVPGVAPTDYKEGDNVDVKAVKMTSAHTQVSAAKFCTDPVFGERLRKKKADCRIWPYHDMSWMSNLTPVKIEITLSPPWTLFFYPLT